MVPELLEYSATRTQQTRHEEALIAVYFPFIDAAELPK